MYRARGPVHLSFCRSLSPSLTGETGNYSPSDSSSSSSANRARTSSGSGNESRSAIATPTHPSLGASLCLPSTRCQTCISRCKNRPHECERGWTASRRVTGDPSSPVAFFGFSLIPDCSGAQEQSCPCIYCGATVPAAAVSLT